MKPVKRDQVWEVLRGGGEWCEAHVINVVSNHVNLHFRDDYDPAKGDAIMVTVEEMQNARKFRFSAKTRGSWSPILDWIEQMEGGLALLYPALAWSVCSPAGSTRAS